MRFPVYLLLFASLALMADAVEIKPVDVSLAKVHRIYVDQLGGGKESDQMRDMIITALQNAGLFVITENPDRADAALKGSGDEKIFTEQHNTSDSIGMHASTSSGYRDTSLYSGAAANKSASAGVTDHESSNIQERRHEAQASVRLVTTEGDVIWSTTQESNGAKFRGAMADVADKIAKRLIEETQKARALASTASPATPVAAKPADH